MPASIEDRDLRRDVVLKSITEYNERCERLFADIRQLRASLTESEQLFFKAFWELLQLRKHVSAETLERITIDRRVFELDPDFSFEQAVHAMLDEDRRS